MTRELIEQLRKHVETRNRLYDAVRAESAAIAAQRDAEARLKGQGVQNGQQTPPNTNAKGGAQ